MFRNLITAVMICSFFLVAGCLNRMEVNDTAVVVAHGWDIKEGKKVLTAQVALPKPREGQESGPGFLVISERGDNLAEANRNMTFSLARKPLWSMADVILLSEELARKDAGLFVDAALRNPRVRTNVLLLLTLDAGPEDVLRVEMQEEAYPAVGLTKIMKNQENEAGVYIPITVKDFLYKSVTSGIEPVITQVSIVDSAEKRKLMLQGTAVFKGKKMVGSLNEQESRGFRFLSSGMISGGFINVKMSGGMGDNKPHNTITLELIRSQAEVKPIINDKGITMQIKINSEGNILEQNTAEDLSRQEMIIKIEEAANKAIKADIQACIDRAQSLDSDVFGWGLCISRLYPEIWKDIERDWPQLFNGVESEISVDYKIRRGYLQKGSLDFR